MKKRVFSGFDMNSKSRFLTVFCLTVAIFMTLLPSSAFAASYGAWQQSGIGEVAAGEKALGLVGSGSIVFSESKYKKDGSIEYKVIIADGETIHKVDFYGDGTLKKMTRENVIGSSFNAPAYGYSAISEAEAGERALGLVGSGSIILSESKYKKDGRVEYKITIADGEIIHKVDFYGDGTLKKMTRENVISSNSNAAAYGYNVIGDTRAIEIALERTGGGTVTKCALDSKKEGLRYEVKVINNGGEYKVKINASTGAIYDYSFKTKGF